MGPDVEVRDTSRGAQFVERRVSEVDEEQVGLWVAEVHRDVEVGTAGAGRVAEHHAMTTQHRRSDAGRHGDIGERQRAGRGRWRWRWVGRDEAESGRPRAVRAVELGACPPPVGDGVVEWAGKLEPGDPITLTDDSRGLQGAAGGVVDLETIDELGEHISALGILNGQQRGPRRQHLAARRPSGYRCARFECLGVRQDGWQEQCNEVRRDQTGVLAARLSHD